MKIWLTTDTHFNHANMVKYCGRPVDFAERIMKGFADNIGPEDSLIHLGDFTMGHYAENMEKLSNIVPGKKVLLIGNHDHKSARWYMEHGWNFACNYLQLRIFGKDILFSHRPQRDDGSWDLNIHGHFHNHLERIKKEKKEKVEVKEKNVKNIISYFYTRNR